MNILLSQDHKSSIHYLHPNSPSQIAQDIERLRFGTVELETGTMSSRKSQSSKSSSSNSSSDLYRTRQESLERRSDAAARRNHQDNTATDRRTSPHGREIRQGRGERRGLELATRVRRDSHERGGEAVSAFENSNRPPNEGQTNAAPATIKDLPDEILIEIADDMDLRSVSNLRQTSRRFVGPANEYLRSRFSVLYLHPTRNLMKQLLEICRNGLYAGYITQLCVLGDPMWRAILDAFPNYRKCDLLPEYELVRWEWCNSPVGGQRFKAWPHRYGPFESARKSPVPMPSQEIGDSRPKGKKPVLAIGKKSPQKLPPKPDISREKGRKKENPWEIEPEDPGADFETCYKPLVGALAALPNLRELGYMTAATHSGLNAVSANKIEAHGHATTAGNVKRNSSMDDAISGRLSDADVVYRLLASPRLRFTKLSLRSELPLYENVARHMSLRGTLSLETHFSSAIDRLTHLDLSMDCGWEVNGSQIMYQRLLPGRGSSLESLRIRLINNPATWSRRQSSVGSLLEMDYEGQLEPLNLPNLQHLELIFVDSPIADEISRHPSGRWPRPPVVTLTRDRFWEPCLKTLKTLRFHHVANLDLEGPVGEYSLPKAIKSNVEYVAQYLKEHAHRLERFDWVVPAFIHHPRCKAETDSEVSTDPPCRAWKCGIYHDSTIMPSDWNEMGMVANELNVEFDYETQAWNFGDYIMRRIEGRNEEEGSDTES